MYMLNEYDVSHKVSFFSAYRAKLLTESHERADYTVYRTQQHAALFHTQETSFEAQERAQ